MAINLNLGLTQQVIALAAQKGVLRNQLAYILATGFWESGNTMMPVREAYWVKNAEAWRKKNLRYWPWYGRGLVQLTWEVNYIRAAKETGVPMDKNPDLALTPEGSVPVLVVGMIEGWFTGKKLAHYITLQKSDFKGARRIINGVDKDDEIAAIAVQYDNALKAIGYGG